MLLAMFIMYLIVFCVFSLAIIVLKCALKITNAVVYTVFSSVYWIVFMGLCCCMCGAL